MLCNTFVLDIKDMFLQNKINTLFNRLGIQHSIDIIKLQINIFYIIKLTTISTHTFLKNDISISLINSSIGDYISHKIILINNCKIWTHKLLLLVHQFGILYFKGSFKVVSVQVAWHLWDNCCCYFIWVQVTIFIKGF